MLVITKEKMVVLINKCLTKFCDVKILDQTNNIDPDGHLKLRLVIWRYGPYRFQVKYIFGSNKDSDIFVPLSFTTVYDGDGKEEKLNKVEDLVKKLHDAKFLRDAGIV